ncbi:MAG TPA: uracil-DNA glycosylase [Povalibacter sp.]|nr:uracil-DNA glycosylase [Povalibacter sp.]
MDARRLSYLRALDIDVWERREGASGGQQIADSAQVTELRTPEPRAAAVESLPTAAGQPLQAFAQPVADVRTAESSDAIASMDWDALYQSVHTCTRCALHATRTQGVFGVGNRTARWMVIGEAPGADEDRQGEPFVGRAGQLLNSMLGAVGLSREQVFIANILKSRPPGNRDPRPEEARACLPYLFRQIELINPTLLLCVGRIAAQTLLETDTPIGKLRGRLHHLASGRPLVVTYHPAYLLRSPGEKRKAWADLVLAMQTFERLSTAERLA